MSRPTSNLIILNFKDRLDWIVANLDTEPSLLRFCNYPNDIFMALDGAIREGDFVTDTIYSTKSPGRKTWERACNRDSVPSIFIDWLLALFPDLTLNWFTKTTLDEFYSIGIDIQQSRSRWRDAINMYARHRRKLEDIVRPYYKSLDNSQSSICPLNNLRLLTRPGWIRKKPLELKEQTEDDFISSPGRGKSFIKLQLAGLAGDYISYKGSLTYKKRRTSKTEPQHNGEIFCVSNLIKSDSGVFLGFDYSLSHYYDYVNTSEILGAELADWVINNGDLKSEIPKLKYRGSPANAFDFDSRASHPGINCLSVFLGYSEKNKLEKGNYFLLHKRDETQLQAQNTVHVLPAGGHQGYSKSSQKKDTAIWRTVVREFLEELFNKEQLCDQSENFEQFTEYGEIRDLIDFFFRGENPAARIYLHGFGLDPITLKPEVIVTIIVDWNKIYQSRTLSDLRLDFNWEVRNRAKSRHTWVELSKSELLRQADGYVQSIEGSFLDTLPAGAACMIATAEHFDLMIPHVT